MEATFDEDNTMIRNENAKERIQTPASDKKETKGWHKVAIGGVTGIALGSGSTLLMGKNTQDSNETALTEDEVSATDPASAQPSWAIGDIDIATSVNDDMKFGEAFATARAEVGPGGAFEWHGNVYATYNADEWNSMSAREKAQFNDHFSWNHRHSSSQHDTDSYADTDSTEKELEVVGAEPSSERLTSAHDGEPADSQDTVDLAGLDAEVEVLGVMQDEDTGSLIVGLSVDGHDAIIVDFDGDLTFDVMGTDINHNGTIEDNELVDIQGHGITLDGIAASMAGDFLTSSDSLDITTDPYFEV